MCDFYGALLPAHLGSAWLDSTQFGSVLFHSLGNDSNAIKIALLHRIDATEWGNRRRTGYRTSLRSVFTVVLALRSWAGPNHRWSRWWWWWWLIALLAFIRLSGLWLYYVVRCIRFFFFCYPSQTPRHSKLVNSCLVVGRLSWALVNVMGLVFICCAAAVIGLGLRLGSGFHFGFSFCQMELYQIKLRLAPKGLAFDKCAFLAISLLWQTDFNMQIHWN